MGPLSFICVLLWAVMFWHGGSKASAVQEAEYLFTGKSVPLLRRQTTSPIVVTGIQGFGIQPRLEIRQLAENADQFNIYLLGLLRFQQTNQSELLSWYQIGGIHGRPYVPWNGVPPAPGLTSPGYCTHVLNTFSTWHRPFVALYEQTLYQNMIEVVNEFPAGAVRARYASAISSWRAPYWDWAAEPPAGQDVFPSFLQASQITVATPTGPAVVHNPLFSYVFHPVSSSTFYFQPFASWNQTKRAPTSWDLNATSRNSVVASTFNNNRPSFQSRLYNLFTTYDNFTEFGNEAWISSSGVQNADSIESLHDVIHAFVGMNGDMTFVDYSAFDPSFMLHHAMVDRALALWQALYPESYVEPMTAVEQTYTIPVNSTQTVDSPLEPFFSNNDGTFWTSATARNVTSFSYSYPELLPTVNVSAIKAAINRLYGPSAGSSSSSKRSFDGLSAVVQSASDVLSDTLLDAVPGVIPTSSYRQYIANVRSRKSALNGSYAIYFFMGEHDSEPETWPTSPSLVGTQAIFAGLSMNDAASDPQVNATNGILVSGAVPLTSALEDKVQAGELNSMSPSAVDTYLSQNLHWRVAKFDATEVPIEDVPGLKVVIVSSEMQPAATPDEFPSVVNFDELSVIMQGETDGGC